MTARRTENSNNRTQRALSRDGTTLIVRLPFKLQLHGGRKLMLAPDGTEARISPRPRIDNTLVRAIARAHRWKRLLEGRDYASVRELAASEKVNESYMCRMLRLTLLAPDIIEAILDGVAPTSLMLESALHPLPAFWADQRRVLCINRCPLHAE